MIWGVKPPTFGDDGGGEGGVAGYGAGGVGGGGGAAGGVGAVVAVSVWRICERYAGNHGGLCGPIQRNDIV
jgi:hypothetical protein